MKVLVCVLFLIVAALSLKKINHPEAKMPIMEYCRYFRYPI